MRRPSGGTGNGRAAPESRLNRYDRMEWAGAFGDLGTLIPFVAGYIGVLGMDPLGILLPLGAAMLVCGLYYRTPIPVQPMKATAAIAITQAAHGIVVTPEAVVAASLVTGLAWLALGLSGLAGSLANRMPRSVMTGVVLGLGAGFMLEGLRMMASHLWLALAALAGTLALRNNRRVPAMAVLLGAGVACGAALDPGALETLAAARFTFKLPAFGLAGLDWDALVVGTLFLALPQLPLTLGNAVIAIRDENNRLFPHRPVTVKGIAVSTGLMNLSSALAGGMPMCHGAGGMAGHVAFGARTGGALVILGGLVIVLGLGFSESVEALFDLFPPAILGVILLIAGARLAMVASQVGPDRRDQAVVATTALLALWNVGAACLLGLVIATLLGRRRPRANPPDSAVAPGEDD
ncbi:MAG: putative sulfate/molybdate transporter [Rhodocyclaceae bacterium]|nr:putative sulfate/molybdate transporter [Rhodocyclaceae bacterium]